MKPRSDQIAILRALPVGMSAEPWAVAVVTGHRDSIKMKLEELAELGAVRRDGRKYRITDEGQWLVMESELERLGKQLQVLRPERTTRNRVDSVVAEVRRHIRREWDWAERLQRAEADRVERQRRAEADQGSRSTSSQGTIPDR